MFLDESQLELDEEQCQILREDKCNDRLVVKEEYLKRPNYKEPLGGVILDKGSGAVAYKLATGTSSKKVEVVREGWATAAMMQANLGKSMNFWRR